MKTLIAGALAVACALSMTACSSRNEPTTSSSMESSMSEPSSSMESSTPSSSMPSSSNEGVMSDLEDAASDAMSKVESAVTPTMSTDFNKIGALDTQQVKWGPGVAVNEENRTTACIGLQEQYEKYSAYFIAPTGTGKFYLTFDEGYENGYTPQILDVLKEKNAKAVFFVTMPFVKSCPELIQRMIDEGHTVGNHTNHHWNPTQKSLEQASQDIRDLDTYMKENFNYQMTLYRPPEGAFSNQVLAMVQQMGYSTVLWSFAYADWDPNNQPGTDVAMARTTKFIHEGAIYLLHAVSKDNAAILGDFIDAVRAKNLEIAPFDLAYVPPEN